MTLKYFKLILIFNFRVNAQRRLRLKIVFQKWLGVFSFR